MANFPHFKLNWSKTAVLVGGLFLGDIRQSSVCEGQMDATALPGDVVQTQYAAPMSAPAFSAVPSNRLGTTPPPKNPFSSQMFDNDFRYKQNPDHAYILGEELKDMPLQTLLRCNLLDETLMSTGGEIRFRYIDELNRLRTGTAPNTAAPPGESSYDQWRYRQYVNFQQSDYFRAYVEMIDASTNHADLPLQGIDKNRWDLQNYFADIWLADLDCRPIWLRVGRQELLYGNQRLISPLDWANTRRNFEGLKLFMKSDDWDVDVFAVNPVNTATPNASTLVLNDNHFDARNTDYLFGGVYSTYKGIKDHTIDLFFLYTNLNVPVAGFPFGDRYTLGTRWLGNYLTPSCEHLFQAEVEGGFQVGNDRSSFYDPTSPRASVQAGYLTSGVGHTWKAHPWQPSLWWFWDFASGDEDPQDGENNTFFQGFGFVHAYLGLIDNVSRQNLSDINFRWTVQPDDKLKVQFAYHWLKLATTNDVLYNVTGNPIGAPDNGKHLGQEFDMTMTYNVNVNWSVEGGYFWFWYGDYIGNVAPRSTAEQLYIMSTLRF